LAQKKRRILIIIVFMLFIAYFLLAARPVRREVILEPKWISSLSSGYNEGSSSGMLLPFTLGSRFGYVDSSGQFAINRIKANEIYLSQNMWTEYDAEPVNIEIKNVFEETIVNIGNASVENASIGNASIKNAGYPILLDNRIFIIGSEQNSLSEIGMSGNTLWTYEFGAPLTCIDAAAGLLVTGSIDGVVEVFNSYGERIFNFEPGGSRYSVILGCAISSDGSRIGIISGIEQQRFLLLERSGAAGSAESSEYKVVYHEFLESSFRRPVRITFIDEDRRIVFERPGGIGCYNIRTRRGFFILLDGEIVAIDDSGDDGLFFVITSHTREKKLIGIKLPQERWLLSSVSARDAIFLQASFKSEDVFLGRTGSSLVIGGGSALISFGLEER